MTMTKKERIKIEDVGIQPTKFLEFLEKFRKGGYGHKISKEVMATDFSFEDPLDEALLYVTDLGIAVVHIPVDPIKDTVSSYSIVRGTLDYKDAFRQLIKAGWFAYKYGMFVGERFNEKPFKDSPA